MNAYSYYSNAQLHSLFSSGRWDDLSFEDRIDACQEVENRYAKANGVTPCIIQTKQMQGCTYGYQAGNTITLNESLLKSGTFIQSYTDSTGNTKTKEISVIAPNWNTLDTIYHEGTHGIQEATGRIPNTYIRSEVDCSLYRIQGIEKEAFAMGQLKTLEAISDVEEYTGECDPLQKDYIEYVKIDSFNSALEASIEAYKDPNIEQTLNDVIQDRDNGINRENCSASYQAINDLCDSQYFITRDSLSSEGSQLSSIDCSSSLHDETNTVSSHSTTIDEVSSSYEDTSTPSAESSHTNENAASNDYGI